MILMYIVLPRACGHQGLLQCSAMQCDTINTRVDELGRGQRANQWRLCSSNQKNSSSDISVHSSVNVSPPTSLSYPSASPWFLR